MGPGVSLTDLVSPQCECWHPAKHGELPSLGSWSVHPRSPSKYWLASGSGSLLTMWDRDVGTESVSLLAPVGSAVSVAFHQTCPAPASQVWG